MDIAFSLLPLTVGIVGSRDFPKCRQVAKFVGRLRKQTTIVSGGAKGVDLMAENTARILGFPEPAIYLPDKKLPIPARFFARNTQIVEHVQQHRGIVFAFITEPPRTGGTQDTLDKCDRMGVPWVSFHMTKEGTWLEPRVSGTIATSLRWQEILFGEAQPNLLPY